MAADELSLWTVYEHPKDFPGQFIARRWIVGGEGRPTNDVLVAESLEGVRKQLPDGLVRLPRNTEDPPVVVETWI